MLRNIMNFIKDAKRTLIELVLSFSLMVTFLTRFIELTNKLYPDTSYIKLKKSMILKFPFYPHRTPGNFKALAMGYLKGYR